MGNDENFDIDKYYLESAQFANSHYENFPVISLFVKKDLRKYTAVIYRYARQADDIADEGSISQERRLELLNEYEFNLKNALQNKFIDGFWRVVADTVISNKLSEENFYNLLVAFKQDVVKNRYNDFDVLLNYCRNSANPIGRLILELHGINENLPKNFSDKICTALQLTNFYQDISVDLQKGRIYIPLSELNIFNVKMTEDNNFVYSENFIRMMRYQIERVKKLYIEGRELLKFLPFRLKIQILVTIKGGEAIIRKIEELNYNVLDLRPTLSKIDFMKLFFTALLFRK